MAKLALATRNWDAEINNEKFFLSDFGLFILPTHHTQYTFILEPYIGVDEYLMVYKTMLGII